jgi:protein PET100, fungi type
MFPIGWMYYFGTNLEDRFHVPDFWPTQEQSHTIPYDKEDIRAEVERIKAEMRERKEETDRRLNETRTAFARERDEATARAGVGR